MSSINEVEGLEIGIPGHQQAKFVQLLDRAVSLAQDVNRCDPGKLDATHVAIATTAAIQSVNSLLSAGSVKCHLAAPPEDIDVKLDRGGSLVYRCYHNPAHEWDLIGHRLP